MDGAILSPGAGNILILEYIINVYPCSVSYYPYNANLKLSRLHFLWQQEVGSSAVDTTITDRVYLDIMECPSLARSDRTLGNTSLICTDGEDLGRIVIGLYGKQVCYLC